MYTVEAMRRRIQGSVLIAAIVEADGKVGPLRVVRSIDSRYGLDEEAVKAARQWLFDPAMKSGAAVPMLVTIQLTFTLK